MDYFTKCPEAYAIPNQEAQTVANAIVDGYMSRFGVPHELHSDQGRNFESAVFKGMCHRLCIKKTRTTPLHPQSDGMVERFNRTIGNQLAMYAQDNPSEWDRHDPLLLLAYRSAVHEATRETPAKVMLGRELTLPVDLFYGATADQSHLDAIPEYVQDLEATMAKIHEFARTNIKTLSNRAKARYDLKASERLFNPGDAVWLYNPQQKKAVCPKLTCPWKWPYVAIDRINDVVYRIRQGPRSKPSVVHKDRLKPYHGTIDKTWLPTHDLMPDRTYLTAQEDIQTAAQDATGEPTEDHATPQTQRDESTRTPHQDALRLNPDVRRGTRRRQPPLRYSGGS